MMVEGRNIKIEKALQRSKKKKNKNSENMGNNNNNNDNDNEITMVERCQKKRKLEQPTPFADVVQCLDRLIKNNNAITNVIINLMDDDNIWECLPKKEIRSNWKIMVELTNAMHYFMSNNTDEMVTRFNDKLCDYIENEIKNLMEILRKGIKYWESIQIGNQQLISKVIQYIASVFILQK